MAVCGRWKRCWCSAEASTLNRSRCGCWTGSGAQPSADEWKKEPDWRANLSRGGGGPTASRASWASAGRRRWNSVRDRLWRWRGGRSSCCCSAGDCWPSAAGRNTATGGGFLPLKCRWKWRGESEKVADFRQSVRGGRSGTDGHRGGGRCFPTTSDWECCSRRKLRRSSRCSAGGECWPAEAEWCTCCRSNRRTTRRVWLCCGWPTSVSCWNPGTSQRSLIVQVGKCGGALFWRAKVGQDFGFFVERERRGAKRSEQGLKCAREQTASWSDFQPARTLTFIPRPISPPTTQPTPPPSSFFFYLRGGPPRVVSLCVWCALEVDQLDCPELKPPSLFFFFFFWLCTVCCCCCCAQRLRNTTKTNSSERGENIYIYAHIRIGRLQSQGVLFLSLLRVLIFKLQNNPPPEGTEVML